MTKRERTADVARKGGSCEPLDVDICIIGGGPAGTSTALHLVRAEGFAPSRIAIVDKAVHPRDKPCAGAISQWGIDALSRIGVTATTPSCRIAGLRILEGGERAAHQSTPLGIVVRRAEFDASLWSRAGEDGVRALGGEAVTQLVRACDGWRVLTERRQISTRLLVAADGAGSITRKLIGLGETARKGHLYVFDTKASAADEGVTRRLCDFDLGPVEQGIEGYYWDFPTPIGGEVWVSRGIYHANLTPRSDLKEVLRQHLAARGVDLDRHQPKPFSTRPYHRESMLSRPGLVLVGEAAGIDATTGEGIAHAIVFGAIAARHLARSLRAGSSDMGGYEREVRGSRMARHLLQSAWFARRVYGPRGRAYRRFLMGSELARAAGARWYRGDRVSLPAKVKLAAELSLFMAAAR